MENFQHFPFESSIGPFQAVDERRGTVRAPYLAKSIRTNGLQVKVLLSTVAPIKKESRSRKSPPPGIVELVEQRYIEFTAKCDAEVARSGVFDSAKPIPHVKVRKVG